jgi:uncharacterized Zn finger protein
MEINFLVQGSAPEPYEVTFLNKEDDLLIFCTCPAGENGKHCKHRLALIEGDAGAIVSGNKDDLVTALAWLQDTAIQEACVEFRQAEQDVESAKKRFNAAKRKLANVMAGR